MVLALSSLLLAAIAGPAQDADVAKFEAMIKRGEFEPAQLGLRDYAGAHPTSWQALYQLGYVEFRLHKVHDSVDALCKSIVLKGDFAESHKILAFDLNLLAHPELAKQELQRAITLDPLSFDSHYELGRLEYEEGNYKQAISEMEKAREIDGSATRVYHNLGLAYGAASNDELAVQSFEKALQLNREGTKQSAWPLIDYATYWNGRHEFEKAKELLVEAERIDSSWSEEYEELGKAYRGMGRYDEAVNALKKAVSLNPRKPELHYTLSRLYAQAGREADAKAELALYQQAKPSGSGAK